MELSEAWKKLEKERLEKPIAEVERATASRHPIAKLKRNYLIKTSFAAFFLLGFVVCLFLFEGWIIRGLLAIVIASYVGFLVSSLSVYKKLTADLPVDRSLIDMLTQTKDMIETNLRFEQRMGLMVYPFAAAVGFLMGFNASGRAVAEVFSRNTLLVIFALTIIVITPIGYLVARWATKRSYGKALEEIGRLIEELRTI